MRKLIAVAIVTGVLLASAGARAEGECATDLIIFSYPTGVNSQAAVCLLAEEETRTAGYDPRLINPGSDQISLRLTMDLGAAVPTVTAVIDGLGFEGEEITLTRTEFLGSFIYDSAPVAIPDGPTGSGCVTATVDAAGVTTAFHTLGGAC